MSDRIIRFPEHRSAKDRPRERQQLAPIRLEIERVIRAQVVQFPTQPSHEELMTECAMLVARMGRERSEEWREHWMEFFARDKAFRANRTVAELRKEIADKRDQLREYAKGVLDEVGWN